MTPQVNVGGTGGLHALARVILATSIALVVMARPARADSVSEARAFLVQSQLSSGAFPGAPIVDTVEALRAIDEAQQGAAKVALFLDAADNSEALFARLAALAGTPYADPAALERAGDLMRSGSWGLAWGHASSDPLVLSAALRFAVRSGDEAAVDAVVIRLASVARLNGSFGFADNADDLALTAEIVRALDEARGFAPADTLANASRQWLLAQAAGDRSALTTPDLSLLVITVGKLDQQILRALILELEARQGLDGGFDGGDVRATALAVQALATALPDVRLVPSSVDVAQAVTGARYVRTFLVSNEGLTASAATAIRVVVKASDSTVYDGTAAVPPLAAGQSVLVPVDLGIQAAVGGRSLTAIVNEAPSFQELDLDDNVVALQFQVLGQPDLVIDASDLFATPVPPPVNQAADVTVRVRNIGSAIAENVHVQLFSGIPGAGGTLVAEQFFNAVAPGTPRLLVTRVTPTSLAPLHLVARVDPENATSEVSEANNEIALDLQPIEGAALRTDVIAALNAGSVTSIAQGATISLSFNASVTETRYGSSYPIPGLWPFERITTVLSAAIGTGAETELKRQVTAKAAMNGFVTPAEPYALDTSGLDGGVTFTVRADADQTIAEADESNNVATKTFTITTADGPELWVDRGTVRVDPPLVEPGATYTVHGTLRNTGKQSATDIRVDLGGKSVVVAALAAGDSVDVPVTLTAFGAGTYTQQYYVDPYAVIVGESSRSNNVTPVKVYVGRSDLEITSVAVDPQPVAAGVTAFVTTTFQNVGTVTESGTVTATVLKSGTAIANSQPIAYPAPGATGSVTVPVSTAGMIGPTPLTVRLTFTSWTGRVVERAFTLDVQNPDFAVSPRAIQIVRSPIEHSEDVRASVVVNNMGTAPGTTSVRVYRGYPEQGDLAASGVLAIAAGGSSVFESAPFPLTSTAAAVVSVVVDEENAVVEQNEGNNAAIRDVLKAPGEIVVAFDESRPKADSISTNPVTANWSAFPGGYADWARDLEARGFTVHSIDPADGGVTSRALRGVDVLVAQPSWREQDAYTDEEIANIKEFLHQGGALLFIGEWGAATVLNPYTGVFVPNAWIPAQDRFLAAFGWTSAHIQVETPGVAYSDANALYARATDQLPDHPATIGVSVVKGNASGAFAASPSGAIPLVRMGNGQAGELANLTYEPPSTKWVAGSAMVGAGRSIFVLDSNFFDSPYLGTYSAGYHLAENRRFALQIVDWLAGGATRDAYPDLVFSPATIEGPTSVVGGDAVEFAATVMNVGDTIGNSAETVTVRFYDGAPSTGRVIGEAQVGALGVDETQRVSVTWDSSHSEGDHVITAVVDPDDRVREFDELHNTITLNVHVQKAIDLRVDPSDIAIVPGTPPVVSVRVHNLGYRECPPGGRLEISAEGHGVAPTYRSVELPAIPARGGSTVQVPAAIEVPASAFTVTASVAAPGGLAYDADLTNGRASLDVAPPKLQVTVPRGGTRWGGQKSVRFTASSLTRPNLRCGVAIAASGGAFTGVPGTSCEKVDVDTTKYSDGEYLVRVSADDGLQSSVQDVPVTVANAAPAIRLLGAAPGSQSVALSAGTASTVIRVPVGSRVSAASIVMAPVGAGRVSLRPTAVWDSPAVVRYRGAIHVFYTENTGGLWMQASYDEGATWTTPQQVGPGATVAVSSKAADVNSFGIHIVYRDATGTYHKRSADGSTWSSPKLIGTLAGTLQLRATEHGLALLSPYLSVRAAVADAEGLSWGPLVEFPTWSTSFCTGAVVGGTLHVVYGHRNTGWFYRRVEKERYADVNAYSAAAQIVEPNNTSSTAAISDREILVARSLYLSAVTVQRCSLERDCTDVDQWLPEPPAVTADLVGPSLHPGSDGVARLFFPQGSNYTIAFGAGGGAAWSAPVTSGWSLQSSSNASYLVEADAISNVGRYSNFEYSRVPALTPAQVVLDVGADGAAELASTGLLNRPVHVPDMAGSINAYLSSHGDADDGATDGWIAVPVSVVSSGAGQIQLTDLEVNYTASTSVAAFSQPAVFSPVASPGVLDVTQLSMLTGGAVAVSDATGAPRRSLTPTASGGRYVAAFDGRDDGGTVLPSGRYRFGNGGTPVADVEIDDLLPTVALRAGTDGSYGGVAPVHGKATDADFAGTAKNFARYVLEYSVDGTTWRSIATVTSPADGVLGHWDTRRLAAGPATLRLTAYDVAGNSATVSRVVGVSPQAPIAPVIDTPAIAGGAFEATTAAVTVAGTSEPGTTVTVYVNGAAAGTAESDGRWSVANVTLPDGLATITAGAARNGLTGPPSEPITVNRYALAVSLTLPERAPAGSLVAGDVTVSRTSIAGGALKVRLSARDSTGAPVDVGLAPAEQLVSLAASGSVTFPIQIASGVRDGAYTIAAEVVEGQLTPARAERVITLEPVRLATATLTSDKAVYGALQVVALEARIANAGASALGGLVATITVTAPGAQAVSMGPYPVDPVPPSGFRAVGALYGTPPLAAGTYVADVLVLDEWANVVATADTTFEVRESAGPTTLAGTLQVAPDTYVAGDVLQAAWSVTNGGAGGPVDVSVLLVRPVDGLVFARHDEQVTIAAGATFTSSTALSTAAADGGTIVAVLLANGSGLAAQSIAPQPGDFQPPVIQITGFADGEHRAGSVTPVVTIADASAFTAEVTLDGQPFTSGTALDAEGNHVLAVHAVDALGYEANATRYFVIDTTPPQVSFAGIADGTLTNQTVIPDVTVTDADAGASTTVLLDGVAWDGLPIDSEGDHVLDVTAQDQAGNLASATVHFTIDKTPPFLTLAGVLDGAVGDAPVQPVVSVEEAHPQSPAWTATLNGQPWFGAAVATEGTWTLTVTATDAAGNAAVPVAATFTTDFTAPVIAVSGVTDGLITRDAVTPVVTIIEANPGAADLRLDGATFVSGTSVTAEGDHVLSVTATDGAGHAATPVLVRFTIDTTPPVVALGGVSEGGVYYIDAVPTFSADDLHHLDTTATLDGVSFTSGATVATDGPHTLSVTARDTAGNTTSRSVSFTVVTVQASLTAALDQNPRVIIVVNCEGQPASCADSQAGVLKATLTQAGIPFDVTLDGATFLQKVRENRHNVRILYRSGSSATNSYWELRELTFEGGGFVAVNDASPDSDPKIRETEGVTTSGKITNVGTVTIAAGDLGPARTLTVSGSGIDQALQSPTATAIGTTSNKTVISTNRYGSGRVVTLTFNPEENDNASMRDLLVQAVRFAAGGALVAGVPGAPQYVKFESRLTSPAGPLDFRLDAWTSAALTPLSDAGTPVVPPRTWTFPLTGAPVSRTMGVVSAQKGTHTVAGELSLTTGVASPRLVTTQPVEVTITGSIAELKQNAITATQAIPAGLDDRAKSSALSYLNAVEPAPPTKAACDTSINNALQATDELKLITGTAAADARAKTDQLLRALQALSPTLP